MASELETRIEHGVATVVLNRPAVLNALSVSENIRKDREQFIKWLLAAPEEEVVTLREVQIDEPEPARITNSVECEFCGEAVMETRSMKINGKTACIPCVEKN